MPRKLSQTVDESISASKSQITVQGPPGQAWVGFGDQGQSVKPSPSEPSHAVGDGNDPGGDGLPVSQPLPTQDANLPPLSSPSTRPASLSIGVEIPGPEQLQEPRPVSPMQYVLQEGVNTEHKSSPRPRRIRKFVKEFTELRDGTCSKVKYICQVPVGLVLIGGLLVAVSGYWIVTGGRNLLDDGDC